MRAAPAAALALLLAALIAGAAGVGFVAFGLYDVAADVPHSRPMYWLLETAKRRSVQAHAPTALAFEVADAADPDRGAQCFRQHCVQCHGGPGEAPAPMARGMEPLPGPLVDAASRWTVAEIDHIVRHGIKMTAMPAWEELLGPAEQAAVVEFVMALPTLTPADFARRTASAGPACGHGTTGPAAATVGDASHGRRLAGQLGCRGCHVIPGVAGREVHAGPPLDGLARRERIAGRLPNTPDNLELWLLSPQHVKPGTAMPDSALTPQQARDIAAYLARLE